MKQDPNPLLEPWDGPFGGVPPFDRVAPHHFPPAFEVTIAERRAEVRAIAADGAEPTFDNTMEPLERAGRRLRRVRTVFSVMTANVITPAYRALEREWSPRLAAAADEIVFDRELFGRIAAVHESAERFGMAAEQRRLAELTYDRFVRRGARLAPAPKEKLAAINQRLAELFADFSARVLADEDSWTLITEEERLAGIPDTLVAAFRTAAAERGLEGWAIVNTRASVEPVLTFAGDRDLRQTVWRRFKSRGENGDENDTREIVSEIVALRAKRANLLGYPSHAHWRMQDTMAGKPERARELMMRVWPAAVARVREEVADMRAIATAEGAAAEIHPWDYLYYAEKVRRERYALDQSEVEPYLELDNLIRAAFWTAERLFGLQFVEIPGEVPVFHPAVRVWKVSQDDRHVGLLYMDNFARTGKRSGAWASTYREHESTEGEEITPLVSNNNNFVGAPAGEPTLISLDDAETLFHEFGHALHALLSEVTYPGLAWTPRDFVEFPSQVLEHWLLTREVLDRFARHYRTGEPMPQELVERILASEKFNQGYATTEYLAAALLDMALHGRPDGVEDVSAFEREALEEIGMPEQVSLRHRLPHFSHLFASDSYSAGYYSYLWSEVMDADTWKAFQEAGDVFDRDLARRMREHLLAPGNSTDRAEAYRRFRGRDPEVTALLELRGLPT